MERPTRSGATAAQVLALVLRQAVEDLRAAESDIRLDRPPAVHDFRVVARRLRSVLVATRTFLEAKDQLNTGLRAAGRAAGPTRDKDVLRQRLSRLLADEPAGTAVLLLRERLDGELEGQRRRAWLQLIDYLDSPAYDELARRLDGFVDLTPWSALAHEPAGHVLPPILEDERSRFDVVTRRVVNGAPDIQLDEALHDLRKRAKSLRYVSDALVPALGGPAKKVRKQMRRVQTVLGDLGDSQLLTTFLESRLDAPELDRTQRTILRRLHATQVSSTDYLRSELLDTYRSPHGRLSAS